MVFDFKKFIESFLNDFPWKKYNEWSLEENICGSLLKKKFRKKAIWEKSKSDIFERVVNSIKDNKPIHIIIPFGWFKHFRNKSAPKTNRAEYFHILNMINYSKDICINYKPWVIIEYLSEDFIVPFMNNYSKEDMDSYHASFIEVINLLKIYFPHNFVIKYSRVSEMCDTNKVLMRVKEILIQKEERWQTIDDVEKVKNLRRSVRSVITDEKYDLLTLNLNDVNNEIIRSRLMELAYYEAECEEICIWNYFFDDNKILALFSFGTTEDNIRDNLTLWSLYNSVVDFWIGEGIIIYQWNRHYPKIISRNQQLMFDELKMISVTTGIQNENYWTINIYGI